MVIKNVRIITCQDSQVVEQGYVEVKEGKITAVGQGEYTGNDPEVLDGQGGFLTPGFIDAHCHLGMWEEGLAFEGDDGNEETDPCTPQLRSLDAINPRDRGLWRGAFLWHHHRGHRPRQRQPHCRADLRHENLGQCH